MLIIRYDNIVNIKINLYESLKDAYTFDKLAKFYIQTNNSLFVNRLFFLNILEIFTYKIINL